MKDSSYKPFHGGYPGAIPRPNFRFKSLLKILMNQRDWDRFCESWSSVLPLSGESIIAASAFAEFVKSLFSQYQNPSAASVQRHLIYQLQKWRETSDLRFAIPGYDSPPENAEGLEHPQGWSVRNLARFTPSSRVLTGFKSSRLN